MGEMPDIGWMELFAADGATERVPSIRFEDAQVYFEAGDRVGFFTSPTYRLTGVIEQLNPKRARVRCGEDTWAVPYAGLEHLCESTRKDRGRRARRLMAVAGEARELMDRHGLADWTLHFNGARTKLGRVPRPAETHPAQPLTTPWTIRRRGSPTRSCTRSPTHWPAPTPDTALPGRPSPGGSAQHPQRARPKARRRGGATRPPGRISARAKPSPSWPVAACTRARSCG